MSVGGCQSLFPSLCFSVPSKYSTLSRNYSKTEKKQHFSFVLNSVLIRSWTRHSWMCERCLMDMHQFFVQSRHSCYYNEEHVWMNQIGWRHPSGVGGKVSNYASPINLRFLPRTELLWGEALLHKWWQISRGVQWWGYKLWAQLGTPPCSCRR